jgi:hypothetical protein
MDPKNQILKLPDKRYPSKRDAWLTVLLLGASSVFFYMPVMI